MILCKMVVIFLSLLRHPTLKYHDYGSLFVNQSPLLYVIPAVIYSNITTSKHAFFLWLPEQNLHVIFLFLSI
jgi:hypothetical protein